MKKKKLLKKYNFNKHSYFQYTNSPKQVSIFLNFFCVFTIFRIIKLNYFKQKKVPQKAKNRRKRFLRTFFKKKFITLKYLVLKKHIFKLFQCFKVVNLYILI